MKLMKNKWMWVYNPFVRIAGWKAFAIGFAILCVTTFIGYFGSVVFFGLEVKHTSGLALSDAFILQFLGLSVQVVLLYLIALLLAKHVRFQDILGTITLAKYPLLLIALLSWVFGPKMASLNPEALVRGEYLASDISSLVIFALLSILILVWEVALLYNAYRVSANLKGLKCTLSFIGGILAAEIVVMLLVSVIY